MPCIDTAATGRRTGAAWRMPLLALMLGACASAPPPAPPAPAPVRPMPVPAPVPPTTGRVLPAPERPMSIAQLREQAARRIVAANPGMSYSGHPPDVLLAVPVLEVELNADGSIRRIEVMRHPRQAKDTTQLAIDAVRRAAPFGDVSRLPRPWKFVETFLFDDDRKFKLLSHNR